MKLSGTALITGASSGIGKAIALSLQKEGVKIVDVSLHTEQLGYFRSVCADITEDIAVQKIADGIEKLDYLFCNAGIGVGGSVEHCSPADVERLFAVNLVAQIKLTIALLPKIKDGGKIFFTGSLASVIPLPYQACYSASKAAIENFARALRTELKYRKIAVCTVMPGDVSTGFTDARMKNANVSEAEKHGIEKMERAERHGKSPESIAKVFVRLAKKKNPPLRASVGEGKLISFLVRILPLRLLNYLVEKLYV